jgi:superfamily II DNA or RNA helicase
MNLEGVWPEQYTKAILPYSLFDDALLFGDSTGSRRRHTQALLDLDPPPRFDLVIVDEAHHVRNPETAAYRAVRFFCDNAEAVVFLTATPIQLGSDDLFVLLNLLRPDLVIDRESYKHMSEPNPHINQAVALARAAQPDWINKTIDALNQAAATPWGDAILRHNTEFQRVTKLLTQPEIATEERVDFITTTEGLYTFAGMINRTRRRDIGEFTIRKSETVIVEFTQAQRRLHDALLETQAEILSKFHNARNIVFMMTTIRRQAASCLYGLTPFLRDILERRIDDVIWDENDDSLDESIIDNLLQIEAQIRHVLDMAADLNQTDPKLERLKKILADKQRLLNNKVMIFSSFRHTLAYLHHHLRSTGYRVGIVHGGTPDEERVILRNRFKDDRIAAETLDVLLFSEVGCEGLDYQFCDCIVNYDLPWNPMRVEQRIGRIDRRGQQSEAVTIYNLITPGTVDADIYERCLVRIGVFERALGGNEEILGEISRSIRNIVENIKLTDEERRQKLQQLTDNKIRLIQEQEKLEEQQVDLFGIRLPTMQIDKEIDEAASFWLTPKAIQNLVQIYLQQIGEQEQEYILGEKEVKTLRLSQEVRHRLLLDLHLLPRQATPNYRDWENWLKGGNPFLSITFDQQAATQHPDAVFITPILTTVEVTDSTLPIGFYPFAIYQWQFHGIRENLIFRPIALLPVLTERLAELLEQASALTVESVNLLTDIVRSQLEENHYILWLSARQKHMERNRELAQFRRQSLETSHRARMSLLQEQLSQATNEKIQRMRRGQLDNAEADFASRIQGLEASIQRADITARPIAFGVLNVKWS